MHPGINLRPAIPWPPAPADPPGFTAEEDRRALHLGLRTLAGVAAGGLHPDVLPLTDQDLARLRAYLRGGVAGARSIWIDKRTPLPFDVFFHYVTGARLTARQRRVFQRAGLMHATDLLRRDRVKRTLVLIWGKGSGKDLTIAALFAWVAYVLMSVEGDIASRLYDLAQRTKLEVMNVATDQETAKTVFFAYLKKFMAHPLVRQFRPVLTTEEARFFRNDQYGEPYECLTFYSKHSNASGIEGHNLILWVGDELDGIERTADGRDRAMELVGVMRSSASTRLGDRWIGAVISYPRTDDGCMWTLKAQAEADYAAHGEASGYLLDIAATHEVRPGVDREHVKAIEEDFRNDPRGARAKYWCQPTSADEPFFELPEKIDDSIRHDLRPVALWRPHVIESRIHDGRVREYMSARIQELRREPGWAYFLGVDAGLSGDSLALAVFGVSEADRTPEWVCPVCAKEEPAWLQKAIYRLQANTILERDIEQPNGGRLTPTTCGYCARTPERKINPTMDRIRENMAGWHRRQPTTEDPLMPFGFDGQAVVLPRFVERLILTIKPDQGVLSGKVRPVYLAGVEALVRQLIDGLGIRRAGFDPWQMAAVAQSLGTSPGCEVTTMSFAHSEQFRRARLGKALCYSDFLHLLPYRAPAEHDRGDQTTFSGEAVRDREWKKLERKGTRVDHPKRGSKDIWDAEMMALWLAATYYESALEISWT